MYKTCERFPARNETCAEIRFHEYIMDKLHESKKNEYNNKQVMKIII